MEDDKKDVSQKPIIDGDTQGDSPALDASVLAAIGDGIDDMRTSLSSISDDTAPRDGTMEFDETKPFLAEICRKLIKNDFPLERDGSGGYSVFLLGVKIDMDEDGGKIQGKFVIPERERDVIRVKIYQEISMAVGRGYDIMERGKMELGDGLAEYFFSIEKKDLSIPETGFAMAVIR